MVSLISPLKRVFSSPLRSGLLAVLFMPPFVFIAFPWAYGYIFGVISHILNGKKGLPAWRSFWGLLKDGIFSIILAIAIASPGYIFLVIGSPGVLQISDPGLRLVGSIIGYLSLLVCSIVLPSMLIQAAQTDSWAAIFDLKAVFDRIFSSSFLIAWLVMVIVSGLSVFISMTLGAFLGGSWLSLAVYSVVIGLLSSYSGLFSVSVLSEAGIHD